MERPVHSSRREVWEMFDRIAPRYDFLNRLLSLRQDVRWRKKMARFLPAHRPLKLLDLATGTGDQLLSLIQHVDQAVGMDMSEGMLEMGRKKMEKAGLSQKIKLATGDAVCIPSEKDCFDAVTMSFGIRNVVQIDTALREMLRVLKPGGRALILEFSTPTNRFFRAGYFFYLRHILPRLGAWLSGDASAYRYLNQTIESFPSGIAFCTFLSDAGFTLVQAHPLTFGIATIYQGDK